MRKKLTEDENIKFEAEDETEAKSEAELKLDVLIPIYGVNKQQSEELEKTVKKQNSEIKQLMSSSGIKNYSTKEYKVTYGVQVRESLNEPQLLEYLKDNWLITCKRYEIIKTKEYIDMDALENAIYNDAFGEYLSNFDKFKNEKKVETLRIVKVKK